MRIKCELILIFLFCYCVDHAKTVAYPTDKLYEYGMTRDNYFATHHSLTYVYICIPKIFAMKKMPLIYTTYIKPKS